MSTDVVVKKLMMFEESLGGRGKRCPDSSGSSGSDIAGKRRRMKGFSFIPTFNTFTIQKSKFTSNEQNEEEMRSAKTISRGRGNERTMQNLSGTEDRTSNHYCSKTISSANKMVLLYNFPVFVIVFVTMMNFARVAECIPAAANENLDSKIKMFLESHCTMQNETLEHEEFQSFMSCGPSHGAGIVKNLGQIPEYKSDDMDQWAKATKREIISQCQAWPRDRTCQETTFRLIEKCFEKDQKFIFYFMFALTDVICQSEQSDLFVKFWQNGGDACLGNHLKTLKKDWSECFEKTSTVSNADVNRNFDGVMQCFRSQFDTDCLGDGSDEVLNEIMAEIRKVYLETSPGSRSSASIVSSSQNFRFPIIFLTGWITFRSLQSRLL